MFKNKIKVFTLALSIFLISIAPVFAQSTQSQTASNNRLQQILNFLMADRVKEAADLMNFTTSSIFITVGGLIISIALLFMSSSIGESLGAAPTSGGGKTGFMIGAAAGGAIVKGGSKLSGATSDWFKSRKNNTGTSTTAGGKGSVGGQSSKGAGAPNQYKAGSNTNAGGTSTGNYSVNSQSSQNQNFSITNAATANTANTSNIPPVNGADPNSSLNNPSSSSQPLPNDTTTSTSASAPESNTVPMATGTQNVSASVQSTASNTMTNQPYSMSSPNSMSPPTSMEAPAGMSPPDVKPPEGMSSKLSEATSSVGESVAEKAGDITGK